MTDCNAARDALRAEMRGARRQLDAASQAAAAQALRAQLIAQPEYAAAARISAYFAVRGEIDMAPLIECAGADGKQIYLPVLDGDYLLFAPWAPGEPLEKRPFGLLEPAVSRDALIEPRELDLALVPLVAFDAAGNRLGMGGGYYDRSFAFLREGATRPVFCGVAHELQRVDALDAESWDVPLQMVATDAGIYRPMAKANA